MTAGRFTEVCMTKQDNILAKYNSLNSEDQTRGFITLPRKFISLELPANEKGLFIQLLLNAGVSPVQDYHYVLNQLGLTKEYPEGILKSLAVNLVPRSPEMV